MPADRIRVAMVGHGFMGAAHSQAWRTAPRFFELTANVEMACLAGRDSSSADAAARRWGWARSCNDWTEIVADPSIDVIDIVTPGSSHAEIAIAALEAGKHVLCEKPLANSVAEAEAMAAAATRSGRVAMVGFSYRRVPAIAVAKKLVNEGLIGDIYQVTAAYLQDWLVDPDAPLTWRLQKEHAGSGVLGDLCAHAFDLVQYVTGQQLTAVSGTLQTIVADRPLLGRTIGLSGTALSGRGTVTVDDRAIVLGRLEAGPIATFEATRFSTGRKNALRVELSGSKGAIAFDLEDMNRLQFYDASAPADRQGYSSILVTEPCHPYVAAWWPPGHTLGYEHAFSHQVVDFLRAVTDDQTPSPSFTDGLQIQRVLHAVEQSAASGSSWTAVGEATSTSEREG
jgi:predicted dehydrogenase